VLTNARIYAIYTLESDLVRYVGGATLRLLHDPASGHLETGCRETHGKATPIMMAAEKGPVISGSLAPKSVPLVMDAAGDFGVGV